MADTVLPNRPPEPHPTPEQLYRARRGPRTAEVERWLAHAAVCAVCTEELLHQEAFDAPQPMSRDRLAAAWKRFGRAPRAPLAPVIPISRVTPITPIAPIPSRPAILSRLGSRYGSRFGRPGGLALAAALVAAVVGLGLWSRAAWAPHPALSSLGGAAAGAWQPAGRLDAPPTEILFPPPSDGKPRRVTVFDISRSYSWTSLPAAGGRVAFPEAERQKLKPGVSYFWTVIDEKNGKNASPRSFRLR